MQITGPAQAEGDHPGSRRFVGEAVDQDKSAGLAADRIRIKSDVHGGGEIAEPDLVQAEGLVRQMRQRIDVDAVLERGNGGRHGTGPDLQQIGAAWDQWMIAHPDHMGCELVDEFGRLAGVCEEITTRDVDISLKGESDRLALLRSVERAFE